MRLVLTTKIVYRSGWKDILKLFNVRELVQSYVVVVLFILQTLRKVTSAVESYRDSSLPWRQLDEHLRLSQAITHILRENVSLSRLNHIFKLFLCYCCTGLIEKEM